MSITTNFSSKLNEEEKNKMFEMYINSYTIGNQPLWFKSKEQLFDRYPCFVSFDNNYLTVYAMFQMKNKYNKISLVCHNGTDEGKRLSIELRYNLITQPGWILEAADKVSWLLRKKNAPIISNYEDIVNALDIKDNPNDIITMNPGFNYKERITYQYTRTYNDTVNIKIYNSNETLFGTTTDCDYINKDCGRKCKTSNGGKSRRKKKRTKKSKKSKRKRSRKTRK
jgi:hypothetical protein